MAESVMCYNRRWIINAEMKRKLNTYDDLKEYPGGIELEIMWLRREPVQNKQYWKVLK